MIETIGMDEPGRWEETVRSFGRHDVYYLPGYARGLMLNGDGEPLLVHYEGEGCRAVSVVMRRDVSACPELRGAVGPGEVFDLATPYGYGGPLVEGGDASGFASEYEGLCRRMGVVSEFVRFHPMLRNWEGLEGLYGVERLGDTVWVDCSSPEAVWADMTSKGRNMVRKAQKAGLRAYWGRDPGLVGPFMEMYAGTMDRDGADPYYYFGRPVYESLLEDLADNAMWFYVRAGGELAAMAVVLFCNGAMHYHLSASRRELQGLAPTNLLLYEAARWGASNGFRAFHLGGGLGSAHDGLYRFKKSFHRGDDAEFRVGRRVFDAEAYDGLVSARAAVDPSFDPETGYFPAYRGR